MTNNCKIVIFFEDHRDNEGLEAITTLLPFFKEQGFKTIALEETSEKNQRAILKQYGDAYKKIQKGQLQDEGNFIKNNYLLIKSAITNGFSIKSIDVSQKVFYDLGHQSQREDENILTKLNEYALSNNILDPKLLMREDYIAKLWIESSKDDFTIKRDENFIGEIEDICQAINAGIIVTLGSGHARIVDVLKEMGHDVKAFMVSGKVSHDEDFPSLMYRYNPKIVHKTLFTSTEIIDSKKYSADELVTYIQGAIEEPVCLNDFCA